MTPTSRQLILERETYVGRLESRLAETQDLADQVAAMRIRAFVHSRESAALLDALTALERSVEAIRGEIRIVDEYYTPLIAKSEREEAVYGADALEIARAREMAAMAGAIIS